MNISVFSRQPYRISAQNKRAITIKAVKEHNNKTVNYQINQEVKGTSLETLHKEK